MAVFLFIALLLLAIWLAVRLGGIRPVRRQRAKADDGADNGSSAPGGGFTGGGGSFGGSGASGGWGDGADGGGDGGGGD